jgi:hypothetical protein
MVLAPGHAHLLAIKIQYTLTVFWLRDSLYPHHSLSSHGAGPTLVMLSQLSTRTAKTRAIPSLHRDNFPAKVPGLYPVLSSGNSHRYILAPRYSDITCRNSTLGPSYCRAVMLKSQRVTRHICKEKKGPNHNSSKNYNFVKPNRYF